MIIRTHDSRAPRPAARAGATAIPTTAEVVR